MEAVLCQRRVCDGGGGVVCEHWRWRCVVAVHEMRLLLLLLLLLQQLLVLGVGRGV